LFVRVICGQQIAGRRCFVCHVKAWFVKTAFLCGKRWQENALFFGIAVGCRCFPSAGCIDKLSNAFVDRRVLLRQIIIILMIREKELQHAPVQRKREGSKILLQRQTGGLCEDTFRSRTFRRHDTECFPVEV